MYVSYGWPRVLTASEPQSQREEVVYLHLDHDFLIFVTTSRIEVWTGGQHRVKLGSHTRSTESLEQEGLNKRAFWSSNKRCLAILTYENALHIYSINSSREAALSINQSVSGTGQAVELLRVVVYMQYNQRLSSGTAVATDFTGDSRSLLIGFSNASMQLYSWQAKLKAVLDPLSESDLGRPVVAPNTRPSSDRERAYNERRSALANFNRSSSFRNNSGRPSSNLSRSSSNNQSSAPQTSTVGIECLEYSQKQQTLIAVLSDGRCAVFRTGGPNLNSQDGKLGFSHWMTGSGSPVTAVRLSSNGQLVAVGLGSGEVALYRLWATKSTDPLRIISLKEWGFDAEVTGSVADLRWSPDSRVLAVGWRRSGMGVWTPSGCRLICTLRQTSGTQSEVRRPMSSSSPRASWPESQGLEAGVALMSFGDYGYRLIIAEAGSNAQILELSLAKSLTNNHRVAPSPSSSYASEQEMFFLLAEDRLLQMSEAPILGPEQEEQSGSALSVHHLKPPASYVAANWPLKHAALSPDGVDIAVAGQHGLALYSRRSARWRLFGDVSHEKDLKVHALHWLPRMNLVCGTVASLPAPAYLLLYPRYHLDNTSCLARFPLKQVPLAIDVLGLHIVVASAPLEILVLKATLTGELTPLGTPTAHFQEVRELSMVTMGQPLQDIALVDLPPGAFGSSRRGFNGPTSSSSGSPQCCVLLRAGGLLSVLHMDQGSEVQLADDIECFWLSSPSPLASSAEGKNLKQVTTAMDVTTSLANGPSRGEVIAHVGQSAYSSRESSPRPMADPVFGQPSFSFRPEPSASTSLPETPVGSASAEMSVRVNSGLETSTSGRDAVEIPWWTYGASGMQLWFPSSLTEPLSPSAHSSKATLDPELEFDKEVYPIGISLSEIAILGVTQRVTRSAPSAIMKVPNQNAHNRLPQFKVAPETQPVLPCLLRRLLQQDKFQDALTLASRHSLAPHFPRSMEWLLFTALEINNDTQPSPSRSPKSPRTANGAPGGHRSPQGLNDRLESDSSIKKPAGPLLTAVARLLRQFPQFAKIVVSVARKTDAAMWPTLFAAIGVPSDIMSELMDQGVLASAACCLVIIHNLEGPRATHKLCHRLIKIALSGGFYELVADLLKFIVPQRDNAPVYEMLTEQARAAELLRLSEMSVNSKTTKESWLGSWFGAKNKSSNPPVAPTTASAQKSSKGGFEPGEGAEPSIEDMAAWKTAWQFVSHHGWRLLDQGRLRSAARLAICLQALDVSLSTLLRSTPDAARDGLPSAASCLAAVRTAEQELPISSDREALVEAVLLKEACLETSSYDWAIALSLILDDSASLAEVKHSQPGLWGAFVALAIDDASTKPYQDVILAVEALPSLGQKSHDVNL